jgi:hypothetical protein
MGFLFNKALSEPATTLPRVLPKGLTTGGTAVLDGALFKSALSDTKGFFKTTII